MFICFALAGMLQINSSYLVDVSSIMSINPDKTTTRDYQSLIRFSSDNVVRVGHGDSKTEDLISAVIDCRVKSPQSP